MVVCPICSEESETLYQCCPNKNDSLCKSCWIKLISAAIQKGKIGLLFIGQMPCDFCHEPIEHDKLPEELQTRFKDILSTIPKTKNPQTIEDFNYSYNDSIELHHCQTKEKFIFLSQRHYNLLGNCLDKYIQTLMKNSPWNYNEIWLPLKDEQINDHYDQVNIFTSNDFQTNGNGCLILIQGSGVVRPGQWARSCCINETLDIGAMFPYMKKAKEHNLSVIILNPNQTNYVDKTTTNTEEISSDNKEKDVISTNKQETVAIDDTTSINNKENTVVEEATSIDKSKSDIDEDLISYYLSSTPFPRPLTKKIPNLSTNREHILYVYDNIITKCPAKKFYIVAHSAGGDGLMFLLRKRQNNILPIPTKIAFTDSVHSLLPIETKEIRNFLKANAIHFVASNQPMGEQVDYGYDFSQQPACQEVSAGHSKHEYTSGSCVEGVFNFFFPEQSIETTKF